MDFEGQKLAEIIFHILIISFGAVGWVIGYFQQDFTVVFQAWLVGLVLSVIICVPDWPFYNRHPVKWLESVPPPERTSSKTS
mmetsp:Transcript_11702/g.22431  ORF Transcript_11702/g.22431 Transcript_11702/m.22431 type:complete len:82 (+) Transcript_11702:119-364(+)